MHGRLSRLARRYGKITDIEGVMMFPSTAGYWKGVVVLYASKETRTFQPSGGRWRSTKEMPYMGFGGRAFR